MTYPEVQFVAAPEDGAEVLFDFNDNFGDAPAAIVAGSFTLGTPSVEGDPDGLGVQYGAREVGFSLLIFGNRYAAMQTQALLARTFMLRRRGWLRVQLDEFTPPVWLRTYTPTPAELDFSLIQPDSIEDAWQIEVTVSAEPFIRGERVELWSGVITDNPVTATNGMQVILPDVMGDAPSPLRIESSFSSVRDRHHILWATSAVPEDYTKIVWPIGASDGWGVSADSTTTVSNAEFVGGTYRKVTFAATVAMDPRLAGPAPSAPKPGRYRVFLRAARLGAVSRYRFKFGYRRDGVDYFGPRVPVFDFGNGYGSWINLGDFDFPLPRTDADVQNSAAIPNVVLAVERLSGSDELALDAFLLVPVDVAEVTSLEPWEKCDALVSEFETVGPHVGATPGDGDLQQWDGDAEVSLRRTVSGISDALNTSATRGTFPRVRPGTRNMLTLIQQTREYLVGEPTAYTRISSTAAVTVSYQPRWLWLGGA